MLVTDKVVLWTASDLTQAAECEFALLRRLDRKLGRVSQEAVAEDAFLRRLAVLGDRHEAVELGRLRAEHGPHETGHAGGVAEIERPEPYTPERLTERQGETVAALEAGADVVFQATFVDNEFHGFADFVVRDPRSGCYRVCDAKLARQAKPRALLQLAAYADQLTRLGVPLTDDAELLLGGDHRSRWPLREIGPVFRERRDRLRKLFARHLDIAGPATWRQPGVLACGRCDVCTAEVEIHDDLLRVAGMRLTQRQKLLAARVETMDQLAASTGPIKGLATAPLARLRAQARLQVQHVEPEPGEPREVRYEVFDAEALVRLPATSEGDLFFDFEGDPMWTVDGSDEWGLEYLFGVVEAPMMPGGRGEFTAWWAHDRAQERQALEGFVDCVTRRRERFPDMHVYHYAAYEKSALLRLASRHGTREDEVDQLVREGVLVDLYAVVRGAVRVSRPSYSIKELEPLYMSDRLRSGGVQDAAQSILQYHACSEAVEHDDDWEAARLLGEIEDYNHYDCDSTLGLRDWLRGLAAEHGVGPGERTSEDQRPASSELTAATTTLEAALREGVPEQGRTPDQEALALLTACVGYHRRERKPVWWAHFDRLATSPAEWSETRDVLVAESAVLTTDWHLPPRARQRRRQVTLRGRWGTGTTVDSGQAVQSVYDRPVAGCHDVPVNALLGCSRSGVQVVGTSVDQDGRDAVVVEEILPARAEPYSTLPVALVPTGPISAKSIEEAIREVATDLLGRDRALVEHPGLDILRRLPPRLGGGAVRREGMPVEDILATVLDLDRSYVAVQGPPGTGKTYVGSHVIARLVNDHNWRVGVVAQGHAVVEHMLDEVIKVGVDAGRVAKKSNGTAGLWTVIAKDRHPQFLAEHADGCVVGGTAWDFTNANKVERGQLDLLVVDEAGQFSLADTLAVSVAAPRLLLLGDPQQLPQVSQGTHPEPVDGSALGWLIGGEAVLPPERGFFLDKTYRMHPELCRKDSELSYDGQLQAKEPETTERELIGVDPGVEVLLVDHHGRSVESSEEADAVVEEVRRLVGHEWSGDGEVRDLVDRDVLVVAPYNAQRRLIERKLAVAGFGGTRVGTVDKFQGQQAPVVVVSMAASAVSDVPRGIDFLLQRNRVNVAISRAQWLTVIVRSPKLTQFVPSTPAGLLQLGAFIALCESDDDRRQA